MLFILLLCLSETYALRGSSLLRRTRLQGQAVVKGSSDELKIRVGQVLPPLISAGIFVGGPINSLEVYACQPQTLDFVAGQIYAWMQVEKFSLLRDSFTHSCLLASLDRRRVVHATGWKIDGMNLFYAFEDYKRRADGKDGTPAALKESTHTYKCVGQFPPDAVVSFQTEDIDRYPLYSIDLFTAKRNDAQEDIVQGLRSGLVAVAGAGKAIPDELQSLHLLRSTDPLAAAVVGIYTPGIDAEMGDARNGPKKLLAAVPHYAASLAQVEKLAVVGTLSDKIDKVDPLSRLYQIIAVILP